MKTGQKFRQRANYFKRSGAASAIGVVLLGLAGVLLIWGWSYVSYIIMCVSTVVGLLLLLWNSLTRSSERDMDAELEHLLRDMDVNSERDLKPGSRLLTGLSPETVEGYEYRQGMMLRRDKGGKIRSSQYTRALFYPMETKLCVRYRMVSFVSEKRVEKTLEIPYADLAHIRLCEETRDLTFGKSGFRVKTVHLEMKWGKETLTVPAQSNVRIEEFVERLQKQIAKSE